MISILAVCNLRTLAFGAFLGKSLVGYYLIAFLFFLLPVSWVTAVFAVSLPGKGGMYAWIKRAFGPKVGLVVVWLQWIYNLVWYPTQMLFLASLIQSLFLPHHSSSAEVFVLSLVLFTLFTLLNCFGMRLTSLMLTLLAILGTLLPLCLLSSMALAHLAFEPWAWVDFWPSWSSTHFVYLSGITFGLLGIEICGFHSENVEHPRYVYPRTLLLAASVIMIGMVLASLAIVFYVPEQELDLLTALVKVLEHGLSHHSLKIWVGSLIVLGGAATVLTWIVGPTRGVVAAAKEGQAPAWLAHENAYGSPVAILLLQWVIFVLLSLLNRFGNAAIGYLYLSILTTQLALVVYLFYFAAFWKLSAEWSHRALFFWWGRALTLMGMAYAWLMIGLGFVLPEHSMGLASWEYALALLLGMLFCFLLPWMMTSHVRD